MTSTLGTGTLPERWVDEGEQYDWTSVFAGVFALVAGLVTSAWPALIVLWAMMPEDSGGPGAGEGMTGPVVLLCAGLLAELGLFVATALLRRRRQRAARWICAVAAPAMPLVGLAVLFAYV